MKRSSFKIIKSFLWMIQECSVAAAAAANTSRSPKFFKLTEAG